MQHYNIMTKEKVLEKFQQIQDAYPYSSSFVCFEKLIRANIFTENEVKYWFNKLVEKDDYSARQKDSLLKALNQIKKNKIESVG